MFFAKALLLFVSIIAFCFHVMPQYTQTYPASILDKTERLKTLPSPKIVLVGNSSWSFGTKSEELEKAFDMPVVNMALAGSNGDAFYEELAKLNIGPGDIYVMTYSSLSDEESDFNAMTAWSTVEDYLELWPLLRDEKNGEAVLPISSMLNAFPVYFKGCLIHYLRGTGNRKPGGPYSRASVNAYGDIAYPRPATVIESEEAFKNIPVTSVGDNKAKRINAFSHYMKEKGASLLLTWEPIPNGRYTAPTAEYERLQREMEEKLDCPVISKYNDYLFDYAYSYDVPAHLTDEGAQLRTAQLIKDIRAWMEESGYTAGSVPNG